MDQNFQTSFIPKKPIIEERVVSSRPVGILLIAAIVVLFIVLLGTGGLWFYEVSINKQITTMQTSLDTAKNDFEPTKITELQLLDKRLSAATDILDNHIAVTPIFTELEKITMHTVRFTKFTYSLADASAATDATAAPSSGNVNVSMSGVAIDYRSIALQSDLFSQDKNFINPVFSNLSINTSGNITFDLSFSVVPSFVNYKQTISSTQS
jgi:hypothetical protein